MKRLLFILTILLSSYSPAMCIDSGTYAIEHHTNIDKISYKLPITDEFKTVLLSALKTGKTVKVVHTVKIRPIDQWFGWLAEKKYTKYYKYNLINNQYYIGVKKDKLKPVSSEQKLLNNVTGLKNAPFLPKNVLQKDNSYIIDFTITINPLEEGSSPLLLFKGERLKERLHSAVHYTDK